MTQNNNPSTKETNYGPFLKSGGDYNALLINRALTGKLRQFVIDVVKAPLEKAIIMAAWLIEHKVGRVTKETCVRKETHFILDLEQKFNKHYINEGRKKLMHALFILLAFEIEHDSHYRWIGQWLILAIIKGMAASEWPDKLEAFPQEGCWKE
jgi:hypothetical protein